MFEVLVYEVRRTAKVEKRIRERVAINRCLHIDDSDGRHVECDQPMVSLGLCLQHVNEHNHIVRGLPTKAAKMRFRAESIRNGQALESFELRRLRRILKSRFLRVADEVA
ncbi:hypothetical protein [Aureliella helgolandensis]|uniref:Uncharacterized protein n=1 Tax=Aureliella helgolandensis TaxID=2527968 RepID=A0A518G2Q0_9BACT|nr:hypothetical protein [Aureliella helgolandensis]QDV22868.1 hypothetical protein Q31a_11610 [Aureliella helgolandensis]